MAPQRQLTPAEQAAVKARKMKRLNDMQLSPVKSLPMNLLMMWMSGNEIQIFSIMITGMAIMNPITAVAQVGAAFKIFDGDAELKGDVFRARLVYIVMCLVALAAGLAKLHFMGLLPTAAADWVDHQPPVYEEVIRGFGI